MHFPTLTTAALLTLAPSIIHAASSQVNNHCKESVYLTITNGTGFTTGPSKLNSGEAFRAAIVGVGNSLGVTKTSDFWSANTPKLIFGTSDDVKSGILYWTVSSVDGDPMKNESFNVSSTNGVTPDVCQHASTYDGQVHACQNAKVALTLDLCS